MKITRCILLTMVAALGGCTSGQQQQEKAVAFTLDDFETVDLVMSDGEAITSDTLVVGGIASVIPLNDSIVAFKNWRDKKDQVYFVNTNTGVVKSTLHYGEGPLETLAVCDMWESDGAVIAVGWGDRKVMRIEVDPSTLDATVAHIGSIPGDIMRVGQMSDGHYVIAPREKGVRLRKLDSSGTLLTDTLGAFPPVKMAEADALSNMDVQTTMATSPDGSKLVSAYFELPWIEIYDSNLRNRVVVKAPVDAEFEITEKQIGEFTLETLTPRYMFYQSVTTFDGGFAVEYQGAEIKGPDDFDRPWTTVLTFDYDGNPLKMYRFDQGVVSISMDRSGKAIYAVMDNPEPHIRKFTLDQ